LEKNNKMNQRILFVISLFLLLVCMVCIAYAEPTTEVHVIKYAEDGTTVLSETTVTYGWMETNLPVHGDGVTHHYHQGPVFEGDKWDPNETANFKDKGAVKGTNVMDLCNLVGGMSQGDEVMIHAHDGYYVEFGYTSVYQPQARQGPMVLCWYNGEDMKVGERQGVGYPPDYFVGMRLVFFADNSINPEGKHVFGNWDMHECLPEQCYHFYELYPSTNGFSVKWVDELRVYSGGYTGDEGGPAKSMPESTSSSVPGFDVIPAIAGLLLVAYMLRRSMR
jgi:hypothetical protein